jgi:hypothetical protein
MMLIGLVSELKIILSSLCECMHGYMFDRVGGGERAKQGRGKMRGKGTRKRETERHAEEGPEEGPEEEGPEEKEEEEAKEEEEEEEAEEAGEEEEEQEEEEEEGDRDGDEPESLLMIICGTATGWSGTSTTASRSSKKAKSSPLFQNEKRSGSELKSEAKLNILKV